jgi:RNA polymerase sigma factor (sigma-70 family)
VGVVLEAQRTVVPRVQRVAGDGPVDDGAIVVPDAIDLTFEERFDVLYARAYAVGFQLLGRRSEAEDVAQETLARAFVHWRKVRGYAEAWVVRVAGNLSIDTWRKTNRLSPSAVPDATTPGPTALRIDLHRALSTLSKRQREVLVLRFLADLPEAEVARALGCSNGSVKVHAARGLAALRTTMGPAQEEVA